MSSYGDETLSEPSNFEYVTTRVRVRKSKLFDDDDYRKLVRMQPNEIARFMEESEYEEEINELGARHTGVDLIEYALYENMSRHFSDIVRWSEGYLEKLVVNYLRRYDAWNIKTILRGIYVDATSDEIWSDLIPAGEFTEDFLEELIALDNIEQVVERLSGTVFGDRLEDALPDYERENILIPLENAVDRTFYQGLVLQVEDEGGTDPVSVYNRLLRAEIDILNVENAVRASQADIDISEYFIEGGELFTESRLQQLVENRDELINTLRESEYGDWLEDALTTLEETGRVTDFDRALKSVLIEYMGRMTNQHPLSMAPVIGYILSKEREVENIRAIARGKEAGLSVEEIENELVI
ncbi:MAG: ATP synthase A1 subunit C [Halobacteria archaeon]|nr:ATP synthase A1 subunit C [Halobacteria archaeon]